MPLSPSTSAVRRARGGRAAQARAAAALADADWLTLSLAAEIARTYVERAALASRLSVLDRGIAQARELARIVAIRQREGVATQVDVGLQAIRVERLAAERSRLAEALDKTRTGLALMVGAEAPLFESLPGDLTALAGPAMPPPSPRALVLARPDVKAAEARLEAAGGDVARARGAFMPAINLSAGLIAGTSVNPGLTGASLGAGLLAPIFERGALKADLAVASARQRQAAYQYRDAILIAFKEMEDALGALNEAQQRVFLLNHAAEQARRTMSLAHRQYLEGEADLQRLLDAEDLVNSAEDEALVALTELTVARIALTKAAGHASDVDGGR